MGKGSFEGLYTFVDVGEIYGIDSSCLRKQVARQKLVEGKDIKKFGKTWIITEQAMVKNFGTLKFEEYKKKQKAQEKKINLKTKSARSSKKINSINEKEEKVNDSWVNGEIKGLEIKNFSF